jgi:ribose 5-phosphate isomerase RpiB
MDAELINKVVQQVLASLNSQAAPAAPKAPAAATKVSPTASFAPALKKKPVRAAEPASVKKIFVTAEMLQQRLAAGKGGVELSHNEYLTPNAEDFAAMRHITVKKQSKPALAPAPAQAPCGEVPAGKASPAATPECSTGCIGVVVERADEKVRGVLSGAGRDVPGLADYSRTNCWMANLRGLCEAVVAGRLAGGVVILPYASDAMIVANKIRGIRAVQGTRLPSVLSAVRHVGANVLILEHAFSTFHEMRSMIAGFAAGLGKQGAAEAIVKTIGELERS